MEYSQYLKTMSLLIINILCKRWRNVLSILILLFSGLCLIIKIVLFEQSIEFQSDLDWKQKKFGY